MGIIKDLENTIDELTQSEAENANALAGEYKNAIAILKGEKLITSDSFTHVIDDMKITIEFDKTKAAEYMGAIETLQNSSV